MPAVIPVSAIVVIINIIVKIYISVRIKNHGREWTDDGWWLYNNGWPYYDYCWKGFQVCPFRCDIRRTASNQETED
jgi:hypothetical protein